MGAVDAYSKTTEQTKRLLRLLPSLINYTNSNITAPPSYRTQPRLTERQVDQLVDAHQTGASTYELADQFGVHRQTVAQHLRARGIDLTPGIDPSLLPRFAALYEAGWSLARIATEHDVSAETLRTSLIKFGTKMRKRHERIKS